MAQYVPGYGTFDPGLPEWLVTGRDGKLYNVNDPRNKLSLVASWTPPDGWRGGDGLIFVPEGTTVTPDPTPPPAPPAPAGTAPQGVNPVLLSRLLGAMRAVIAHDTELMALANQRISDDTARMQEGLRLAVEADKAFDAVLSDLQSKV